MSFKELSAGTELCLLRDPVGLDEIGRGEGRTFSGCCNSSPPRTPVGTGVPARPREWQGRRHPPVVLARLTLRQERA